MINPELALPGAAVVAVLVVGSLSFAVAPEIGRRLADHSGAVAGCEKGLLQELKASADREALDVETPVLPEVDIGAIMGGLLGGRPGSDAFMDRYGAQFRGLGDAMAAPMRAQSERARDAAKRQLENIERRFQSAAMKSGSECGCRAIEAVNRGHTALAVFTATGGLVSWSPVGNFPEAMSEPGIVAQCKGMS